VKRRAGISHTTFYKELKSGRLKARKIGNRTVVLKSDYEAWLSGLPSADLGKVA
jgi:predicted DNA-binding transcriptional regulator AlpA